VNPPSYSPELSDIEPICNDVKHNQMSQRTHQQVCERKDAVDSSLAHKTERLLEASSRTTNDHRMTALRGARSTFAVYYQTGWM
jgi:hypothetical protein